MCRMVLEHPHDTISMLGLVNMGLGQNERPNVDVWFGYGVAGRPLVVYVDGFEGSAFHSEPGGGRRRRRFFQEPLSDIRPGWTRKGP